MDCEQDENLDSNMTVRVFLLSGEIRYKDGISKKMIVAETRRTPKRVYAKSQRKTGVAPVNITNQTSRRFLCDDVYAKHTMHTVHSYCTVRFAHSSFNRFECFVLI